MTAGTMDQVAAAVPVQPRAPLPASGSSSSSTTRPRQRASARLPSPDLALPAHYDSLVTLSRVEVAARIARGELLVLQPPLVYRVPHKWLDLHPGGHHAILHYVGRDASCEIMAYHTARTVEERMARWIVGRVDVDDSDETEGQGWIDMTPPIQLGKWPIPIPTITVSSPPASPARKRVRRVGRDTQDDDDNADDDNAQLATDAHAKRLPDKVPQSDTLTPAMVDPPLDPADYEHLPLTPAYQAHLRRSVKRLYARLQTKGLDRPPRFLAGYGPSLVIYIALAVLSVWTYRRALGTSSTGDYLAAAVCLGAFYHQVTFVVHDAGHTGLTGSWMVDRLCGIGLANFIGGLSLGWWADNHNVHHLVTNAPEHDPDIQHLPFFAISTRFFDSIKSTYYDRLVAFDAFARFVLPYQHKLYYIVMCFARFNLFALSYSFLLTRWPGRRSPLFKLRILELVGIIFFWSWFGGIVLRNMDTAAHRWLYVIVSFAVTSPLHVQIVLSHFSQPISIFPADSTPADDKLAGKVPRASLELLESHPHRQLRTTMDVSCPTYLDFLHGGLNFQTPHHFFPRIPRFNFRAVAKEIERWVDVENAALETRTEKDPKSGEERRVRYWRSHRLKDGEGLVYKKMTFVEGNRSVLGVLKGVAQQVELLAKVAEKDAKGELHHH
ncbi:hypothetical protein BMF94_2752 [Rhodotorula taiwanensis]|uniref:Delta 8-(E)-sphingolipid desaturase n=1 Tax=Rhodotorula taiwanensis TaxID=741276 RepID=A0A2S5BBQ0_9BASI|nr:hypothetical protein BMF94_2752 [Rhodotorula taiwanensis]